jgi:hypothetical protein
MMNQKQERTLVMAIAAVVIVFAVVVVVLRWNSKQPAEVPEVSVQQLSVLQIPQGFPTQVPIEAGASIVQNYTATMKDGRVQGTRAFESAKSVKQNFDLYKAYLSAKGNGWTITSELNDTAAPNHLALFAKNAVGTLGVDISKSAVGVTIVNVTFSIPKAQ